MKLAKYLRTTCIFVLSLMMSHIPSVALAGGMISTNAAVADLSRAASEQKVQEILGRDDVKKALAQQGFSTSEVTKRIAGLSDREVNQLANQMTQARYGGDILGLILIILLIVFLIERV